MATNHPQSPEPNANQPPLPVPKLIPLPPPHTHSLSVVLIQPQSPTPGDCTSECTHLSCSRKPTLIAFHGSGDSLSSWLSFAQLLQTKLPQTSLLLYSRAAHGFSTGSDVKNPYFTALELLDLLHVLDVQPPYILLGHSYGGCIARWFLHIMGAPVKVAGMVLVETGQETRLPSQVEKAQMRRWGGLVERPLVVIRGNSMMGKWKELEEKERGLGWSEVAEKGEGPRKEMERGEERARLAEMRCMLEAWDREDVRLKRVQLGLSTRSRFVQVAGVGHHVVRDRPEAVVEGVKWVLDSLNKERDRIRTGLWGKIWEACRRRLSKNRSKVNIN